MGVCITLLCLEAVIGTVFFSALAAALEYDYQYLGIVAAPSHSQTTMYAAVICAVLAITLLYFSYKSTAARQAVLRQGSESRFLLAEVELSDRVHSQQL